MGHMMQILSEDPGYVRIVLAVFVAIAGDVVDYFGGFAPWVGEPFDVAPALINAFLLRSPWPLLGAGEAVSIFPPLALLDFIPTNIIVLIFTLIRKVEAKEGTVILRR